MVLAWRKRIWRCREPACGVRTWTGRVAAIHLRAVLTEIDYEAGTEYRDRARCLQGAA
jgi:hypothetical protein